MALPSMPAMPGMSLPSVPMPSMSLPSLSLPDWIPLGPYSSAAVATQQPSAHGAADSSSTAEQSRGEAGAAQQEEAGKPADSSGAATEASTSREHEGEGGIKGMHQAAPAGTSTRRAENTGLPLSTHATGVHASMHECKANPSHLERVSEGVQQPGTGFSRIDLQAGLRSSSTSAQVGLLASSGSPHFHILHMAALHVGRFCR